jgi:hypothetical protein
VSQQILDRLDSTARGPCLEHVAITLLRDLLGIVAGLRRGTSGRSRENLYGASA